MFVCLIHLSCLHVESALSVFRAWPALPTCPCHAFGLEPTWETYQCRKSMGFVVRRPGGQAGLGHVAAERTRTAAPHLRPSATGQHGSRGGSREGQARGVSHTVCFHEKPTFSRFCRSVCSAASGGTCIRGKGQEEEEEGQDSLSAWICQRTVPFHFFEKDAVNFRL